VKIEERHVWWFVGHKLFSSYDSSSTNSQMRKLRWGERAPKGWNTLKIRRETNRSLKKTRFLRRNNLLETRFHHVVHDSPPRIVSQRGKADWQAKVW